MKEQEITKAQRIENPVSAAKNLIRPRLLTVKEGAIYLGRSVPSIRELIWAKSLPIVRMGRRIHLDILDLEKWIDQHKIKYTY